jgi:hypothetical protein
VSRLIYDQPERFGAWAGKMLDTTIYQPFTAIGVEDEQGNEIAAAIFNGYTGYDVELTLVGKGKFTRGLWRSLLHYGFQQLNVSRVTMRTRASNIAAIKLAAHFGARFEGRLRRHFSGEDAIVFGLLREELKGPLG